MPRMPETIIKTPVYIYPNENDAVENSEYGGTGFFFQVPSEAFPTKAYTYVVTNAHLVFRDEIEHPILRINTVDNNFDFIPTLKEQWVRHPNGDDLAICRVFGLQDKHEIVALKKEDLIDMKFINDFNIGPGDEAVMIGRFRVLAGKNKNLPTHCFGNIAAMNNEPIYNEFTQLMQESFIVEMRSISGFSGSPVIVYIEPMSFRFKNGFGKTENLEMNYYQRLLGIVWGHIKYQAKAKNQYDENINIEMDSAMAGVVPAWKLIDIIDSGDVVKNREENDVQLKSMEKSIRKSDM